MNSQSISTHRLKSGVSITALVLALALTLGGCASKRTTTGSINPKLNKPISQMTYSELKSATNFWRKEYERSPKDKRVGLNFAASLRSTGRNEQALAVMQQMAIFHPEDRQVLAAYGKALAGAGQLKKALGVIQRAQTPDNPDWKLHSAEGAIYDQIGQSAQARLQYRKALDLSPNEPSVLSNLGMSYLLTGDLRSAETYMKNAFNQPNAGSQVRQNLALVVGLQGRFKEAETIAAGELPPAEAQANITYLRQVLTQQNAWSLLKDKKKNTN